MNESERIAIAARLHVALRRKTGRVTDTEWLAVNPEYAAEIVRFARANAAETNDLDLNAIASRLEFVMAPLATLAAAARPAEESRTRLVAAAKYVGGLR
ncbi:MAG: hypothetical protein EOO26_15350 [Comamonadaceae bacterium]|nr:MAG: hypothetical protein EOO26_15350 [Comamonadaceae bacterium]